MPVHFRSICITNVHQTNKLYTVYIVSLTCSFTITHMNIALQLVNWCSGEILACLLGTKWPWRSHVFLTMLLEKVLRLLPNVTEIKEKQKKCLNLLLTALFKNTRILKFKSQLTFAFFAAVNHLSGPRGKKKITSTGSKGHCLWLADFNPFGVTKKSNGEVGL